MKKSYTHIIHKAVSCTIAAALFLNNGTAVFAASDKVTSVLPAAGASFALSSDQVSLSTLQRTEGMNEAAMAQYATTLPAGTELKDITDAPVPKASSVGDAILKDIQTATGAKTLSDVVVEQEAQADSATTSKEEDEALFRTLVIADVRSNSYVNVRSGPGEDKEIIGKLYDNSVGTYIDEEDGWYKIQSGSVTGFVKGEFCVTGEAAVEMAREVGTRIATVTTTTLKVRKDPDLDAEVLGLVPIDEQLVVSEELDGWVKVDIEEGEGYVSAEYVRLSTEFVKAESKEEEEARLAKERAARAAANAAAKKGTKSTSNGKIKSAISYTTESSSIGQAVASFAQQFVGNPYVYGGTSLTNGADCSGFVMSVYSNFGVSLPHSSAADRVQGAAVDGLANAQPGDLVCYSGHVAIYIGGGKIVHASTSKTGIIVSDANYRKPLAVRRIF
ncbi:MAG: SH3 domain-containing protein [Lachnospiraceae bacterium]|nr:SH3 domain-containing protein [Lachnospiraceae bacterium]